MRSDVYKLVTVNDGKSDTAAIVKVLSEISNGRLKSDLKLLNYCEEVPVSYGSSVTAVDDDSVEFVVHEHQALIMKHDKSTLIKSRHFHNELGVHCYAAYVNVPKKSVVLHNFAYAQIRAERREAVRVRVNGRVSATFSYGNVTIEGIMLDISGNGISFVSKVVPATECNQPGNISLTLSGTPLEVPGMFVRSAANENGGNVCLFQMKPDRRSDTVLGQFIYQRQIEIIQQLKDGLIAN